MPIASNSKNASILAILLFFFFAAIIIYFKQIEIFSLFSGFFGLSFPIIRNFIQENILHQEKIVQTSFFSDFLVILFATFGAIEIGALLYGIVAGVLFGIRHPDLALANAQNGVIAMPYAEYFQSTMVIYQSLCVSIIAFVFALYEKKHSYLITVAGSLFGFMICVFIDKIVTSLINNMKAIDSSGNPLPGLDSDIILNPSNLILIGVGIRFAILSAFFVFLGRMLKSFLRKFSRAK